MSDAPTPPASEPSKPPATKAEGASAPVVPPPAREDSAANAAAAAGPSIQPREPDGPPGKTYFWGTGRRKRAVARVRIRPGDGTFKINGRDLDNYFRLQKDRQAITNLLDATETKRSVDVFVNLHGGGTTGQAGAVVLGIARALKKCNPDYEPILRQGRFLTRDARKVERKKYGQRGARRRFQFSKR